jgi:hypothetical protein
MGKFGDDDNAKPINNVTELAAFDPDNAETIESSNFPPTYFQRKFIPLSPSMIAIILKHEPDEISGIINEIRAMSWSVVENNFELEDEKINFLGHVYKVIQALWVHGQDKPTSEQSDKWKFIRSTNNSIKETTSKWAIEKADILVNRSSSYNETDDRSSNSINSDTNQDEDESKEDLSDAHETKKNTKKKVNWHPSLLEELLEKTTVMT